jgi:hypothetical protein
MAIPSPWSERAKARSVTPNLTISQIRCRHSFAMRWGDRVLFFTTHAIVFTLGLAGFILLIGIMGGTLGWVMAMVELFVFYLLLALPIFLLAIGAVHIGKHRIKSRVLQTRCQLCVHCFYDLSARPRDDDTCPECGLNAPRRECVRLWCKLLRSRF